MDTSVLKPFAQESRRTLRELVSARPDLGAGGGQWGAARGGSGGEGTGGRNRQKFPRSGR